MPRTPGCDLDSALYSLVLTSTERNMYLSISSFHPFAYLYNALNDNMLIHMYIDACTCTFPTMFRIDLMSLCFCELMLCSEKADSDFEIHSTKTQITGSFNGVVLQLIHLHPPTQLNFAQFSIPGSHVLQVYYPPGRCG